MLTCCSYKSPIDISAMKRILLVSALLLASISLFAAKPLKVSKGSLDVFKQDVTASWTIDLSEAQFVNNGVFAKEKLGSFQTWAGEDGYQELTDLMNESFFDTFNIYCSAMELVKEADAPCKVILKIDTFERTQGNGPLGSCYIGLYGTLQVLEAATGDTKLEVKLTNVKGEESFDETPRFPTAMKCLCRDLFNLKK